MRPFGTIALGMTGVLLLWGCARQATFRPLPVSTTSPAIRFETASSGTLRDRLAPPDDAQWVLLYGGEQKGSLATCGCPEHPLGSVERIAGYRNAMSGPPSVLVNTGYWLHDGLGADGRVRTEALETNRRMLAGLSASYFDALNISYRDWIYLKDQRSAPEEAVSANLTPGSDEPVIQDWLVIRRNQTRIGVTGVSRMRNGMPGQGNAQWEDPVDAARRVIATRGSEVDWVVLLTYELTPGQVASLAALEEVDVLVESHNYTERWEPFIAGKTVWVRSDAETRRLGELRLFRGPEGEIRALDRRVTLDDAIPSHQAVRRIRVGRFK